MKEIILLDVRAVIKLIDKYRTIHDAINNIDLDACKDGMSLPKKGYGLVKGNITN